MTNTIIEATTPRAIRGARVELLRPGRHTNVHVISFSGHLYANIIEAWNVSPETVTTSGVHSMIRLPYSGGGIGFMPTRKGIFPSLLEDARELLTDACCDEDFSQKAKQFTGTLLFHNLHHDLLAEVVTSIGAALLKAAVSALEAMSGVTVIGYDTDTVTVTSPLDPVLIGTEARRAVHLVCAECNAADDFNFDFESKSYDLGVFVARKRYVLWHDDVMNRKGILGGDPLVDEALDAAYAGDYGRVGEIAAQQQAEKEHADPRMSRINFSIQKLYDVLVAQAQ